MSRETCRDFQGLCVLWLIPLHHGDHGDSVSVLWEEVWMWCKQLVLSNTVGTVSSQHTAGGVRTLNRRVPWGRRKKKGSKKQQAVRWLPCRGQNHEMREIYFSVSIWGSYSTWFPTPPLIIDSDIESYIFTVRFNKSWYFLYLRFCFSYVLLLVMLSHLEV